MNITVYIAYIAVGLALAAAPLGIWRRTLARTREKAAADSALRETYGQYWMEVRELAQRRMLNASSDEEWLAYIRERASVPARQAFRPSFAAEASAPVSSMRSVLIDAIRQWMSWNRRAIGRPVIQMATISAVVAAAAATIGLSYVRVHDEAAALPRGYRHVWSGEIPAYRHSWAGTVLVAGALFFDHKSKTIPPSDDLFLSFVVEDARSQHLVVSIVGYAADGGTLAYNRILSLHRATAVRDELIALGLPSGQVTQVIGRGADDHPLDDCRTQEQLGARECVELRRVVITLSSEKGIHRQ